MNKALHAGMGIVAALAASCVIEAAPVPVGVVVTGPPPPPMEERRPPALATRSVWIPGYWHWSGMQYTWIPGHWEAAPPGASWRAPRYQLHDGVYYYEPGGWGGGR